MTVPRDDSSDVPLPSETDSRAAVEVDAIVAALATNGEGWKRPTEPLQIGNSAWRPSLFNERRQRILHVHISQRVPQHISVRIAAAKKSGFDVNIACHLSDLYDMEFLRQLAELEASVYILDDKTAPTKRRHILAAVADLNVPVPTQHRKELGQLTWSRRGDGDSNEKGRRLEALLAFLLSQVGDFRIFDRNFRNESQEIDIVLQVDSHGSRSWHRNAAFILVESKNTTEPIGQPQVSVLFRKLETKRGSAKIALMFSVGGYTADAGLEEIRSATSEYCVAMLNAEDIEAAIDADDIADFLERKVSRALLR